MENERLYKEYHDLDQVMLGFCFVESCKYGRLEDVKYLLTSPDLKEHADIHYREDFGFRAACNNGHYEIVKYLTTSPDLNDCLDVSWRNNSAFLCAYDNKHYEIIRFLIFELSIEMTGKLEKYFMARKDEQIIDWFKIRDLNNSLEKELNSDKINNKKFKI